MLGLSKRAQAMPPSPIRKLAPFAAAAKARGVEIFHLNIGQPDVHTPQCGLDALKKVDAKVLAYSPSQGIESYRNKLVGYYAKHNAQQKAVLENAFGPIQDTTPQFPH